mgnify:FL=1
MRKLKARSLALPFFLLTITTSFQNCDGGFVMNRKTGELSSTSTGDGGTIPTTVQTTGPNGLKTYGPGGAVMADTIVIDTAMDYTLMASGTGITSAILTWSISPTSNTASCSLGSTGSNYSKILRCLTAGAVQVRAEAIWADGTNTVAFVNRTVQVGSIGSPPGTTNPDIIEFRIRSGTANGAWNTASTPVVAFVGQTLKIVNDDTMVHRLHTNGNPCIHQPNDSAPNATYDCVIAAVHAPATGDLYDHNVGTSATFFLQTIDGAAQYNRVVSGSACVNCHGALATSEKRGRGFNAIKNAILSNTGGMGTRYGAVLTDDEIRAIAYSLR